MSIIPKQKFWMVYGMDAGAPTVRHETFDLALAEAKRLARKNSDTAFVVLEATAAIVKREFDLIALLEPHETFRNGIRVDGLHSHSFDDDFPF